VSLLPTSQTSKLLRAFTFNPRFSPRYKTAHEELIEQMVDDLISALMVSRDATPVAFVVPEGCDSLDLLYGPVEVNPGCGCDADLKQIVTVGTAKLRASANGIVGPLKPGDPIIVTVPWRAASWVDVDASALRMQVLAFFYRAEPPLAMRSATGAGTASPPRPTSASCEELRDTATGRSVSSAKASNRRAAGSR
jgi:hypothetical protein